ncbi:FAD-binding oxidoreductase [Streptomyces fragilis]|uniref:FAD-binding oxidoreductase n=1 Tax=Streptomyces fragilis TaxID=67301 RepID=A0ABV2YD97_9ACTN|nr:FAD-binding oxidoreductase [Streptomyces fragilis]
MDATALDGLRTALRGRAVTPGNADYDEARRVYNGMIDRRPAAVVRCVDAADVRATLAYAQETGTDLAVRGGGHSAPGASVIDGGITLDLTPMRWVRVDAEARIAQAGGGSLLGDLDHATHTFGLGIPAGNVSSTGLGGLTLGGGHGHLTRAYGLTVDSLIAADVILADGRAVTATEENHPDLFWALRGGGGNFGVVTSFTFRLHPVHTVGTAITVWPIDRTTDVLRWYREFLPSAPEDLNGFFAVMNIPPVPPFPEPIHGRKMAVVVWCYSGDLERNTLEELRSAVDEPAPPAFHFAAPMPYPVLQSMFDPLIPEGLQWYWRGDFFDTISDEAAEVHERYGSAIPTALSTMHLYPVDGAAHRVGSEATAWAYRDAVWSAVISGIDPDPANADLIRQWCVDYWSDLHPHSMGGAYVNFLWEAAGPDHVRSTYRGNYDRLADVKRAYDPYNFFQSNHNIAPATAA